MLSRFDFRFVVGLLVGVPALIWSVASLIALSRSPARNGIVYFNRGAPITQVQIYWGMAVMSCLFIAAAFAFQRRR
jgi:hypothetical protein